jgi:glycosyltransferase involved in cell wall biosynthesis
VALVSFDETLGRGMTDIAMQTDRDSQQRSTLSRVLPSPDEREHSQIPSRNLLLSVVMPCLNEARTLGICIRKAREFIDRSGLSAEIIVADNGSTDGSQDIARDEGARVVDVSERGYGAALIAGITASRGTYIVMGDSDDSYDFGNLSRFIAELDRGADLVMGDRFAGGIAKGAMPWHHKYVGNPILSFIGRLLFSSRIRDFHCGLRAFRRDSITRLGLSSTGMEFASEMIVKAELNRLVIAQIPTTLSKDGRDRPPHLRSFRDGWRHLKFLLMHSPDWLFFYPGLCLLTLGWLTQLVLSSGIFMIGKLGLGVHTMLYGAAAGILGLQLVVFSVLSHLIGNAFGALPTLPAWVLRLRATTTEFGLVLGATIFLVGAGLAMTTVGSWIDTGFTRLDPTQVMRAAIPATALMISGVEVSFASFLVASFKRRP